MRGEELFHTARDLPSTERSAFLLRECGDDEVLLKCVERLLLAAGEEKASILDSVTAGPGGATDSPAGLDSVQIPPSLGRYLTKEVIGRGSNGLVLRSYDEQLDRDVAIKIPRRAQNLPEDAAEAFVREARQVARLRHPGIVSVHDVQVVDGTCFIVSEFLDGLDLSRWLETNPPSWREVSEVAAKLAEALAYAHTKATIHRDIKPSNIIMTADGQPVLVDFGLALSPSIGSPSKGGVVGTPIYMSPEQARGEGHRIDGRTDIYSLGAVLYQMLTGLQPFQADNTLEVLRRVIEDEPQPPRQLVPDLPTALETACLKAMAKRMEDRHATAYDLAAELRAFLASEAADREVTRIGKPDGTPMGRTSLQSAGNSTTSSPELRQVTVLAVGCDCFDSEEFLEKLEPEDQAEVLRQYQDACHAAITRSVGSILSMDEEKVLVSFGYPVAFEDAAHRAVLAGMAVIKSVAKTGRSLRSSHGIEVKPWAAVHTGTAVVESNPVGSHSVTGEARTVATHLKAVAEANRVLITAQTKQLCERFFEFEPKGTHKVRGHPRPLETFLVGGKRQEHGRFKPNETGLSPLTGRDREVGLLEDRWDQALEGMGQVVTIIGEAGLGKSRLVHTIRERIVDDDGSLRPMLVEWTCSPLHQNSALQPAIDHFGRILGFQSGDEPAQRLERLAAHLEELGLAGDQELALLANLLSLPIENKSTDPPVPPAKLREQTLEVLGDWLSACARRNPLLLIVEDLHWIDPTTLEFLTHHLDQGFQSRILTLLTFRPEFETPWKSREHQTVMALSRLTRRQTCEMVQRITGVRDLPRNLLTDLADRTSGVPLFVEEFTSMIEQAGILKDSAEESGSSSQLPHHEIPATLQDLLMVRFDRIAGGKEVAQLAAVLGREFSYELIHAVSNLNEDTLQNELDTLVRADLLLQSGRYPSCEFIFKHALLRDASYNSLLRNKRLELHKKVAEAIERRFPEVVEHQPELLALHYANGGCPKQAVGSYLKAGLRSRERWAELEAIEHLSRGVELLGGLEAGPARDELELRFRLPLATAYLAARGYASPEAGAVLRRAGELAEQLGEPAQIFSALWGMWAWHIVRGEHPLARTEAADMREWSAKHEIPGVAMDTHFPLCVSVFYQAEFADAGRLFDEVLTSYEDREGAKEWSLYTGQNCCVVTRSYFALTKWHLGESREAEELAAEAVSIGRELSHPFSLSYALCHAAVLHLYARQPEKTEALAKEAIELADEQDFTFWHAWANICLGSARLEQGLTKGAWEMVRSGVLNYRATGAEVGLTHYLCLLGDADCRCGQIANGLKTIDEAMSVADKNGEFHWQAELHRRKGHWLLQESDENREEAGQLFAQAIEIAQRQGSLALELRATTSLCRLMMDGDRRDEGMERLRLVCGKFPATTDSPDLRDARELLGELA